MLDTPQWRKSSYSGMNSSDCLEVRDGVPGAVPVRDSKRPADGHLLLPTDSWQAFVTHLKH